MRWRKFGIVFRPDTSLPWSRSHAMVPTPLLMPELGVLRVFYTACDDAGIGRPSYVDLDPQDPTRIVSACTRPLLDIGKPGTFDENGVIFGTGHTAASTREMLRDVGILLQSSIL